MRIDIAAALGLPLLLALACQAPISETGALRLEPNPFNVAWVGDDVQYNGTQPILVGSRLCPSYSSEDNSQGVGRFEDLTQCFNTASSGPISDEADCFDITGAGEISLSLTPNPAGNDCEELTLVSDSFTLPTAEATGLVAQLWYGPERYLTTSVKHSFAAIGDALPELEPELYVTLADELVSLPVEILAADGSAVAYQTSEATTGLFDSDGNNVHFGSLQPELILAADQVLDVEVNAYGNVMDGGQVVAVPRSALDSIELFVGVMAEPDAARVRSVSVDGDEVSVNADGEAFLGARAVIRDTEGRIVHGVPVTWSVDAGALSVQGLEDFSKRYLQPQEENEVYSDAVIIGDLCHPPEERAGERALTLTASVDGLSATRSFTLEVGGAIPEDEIDLEPYSAGGFCLGPDISPRRGRVEPGCACRGTGAGPGLPGLLLLSLLVLVRRRGR